MGSVQINKFGRPFFGHKNCYLSLSGLCPEVEKKVIITIYPVCLIYSVYWIEVTEIVKNMTLILYCLPKIYVPFWLMRIHARRGSKKIFQGGGVQP